MYYKITAAFIQYLKKKKIKTLIAQNIADACETRSFVQLPMKANK